MVKHIDNNGFNKWMQNRQMKKKPSRFSAILWWTILFLGIWWLASAFFAPKPEIPTNDTPEIVQEKQPYEIIENSDLRFQLSNNRISNIELMNYANDKKSEERVCLLCGDNEYMEFAVVANGTNAPDANTVWKNNSWTNADGVKFEKYINTDGYTTTVSYSVFNNSKRDFSVAPVSRIVRNVGTNTASVATGLVVSENGDINHESWKTLSKKPMTFAAQTGFAGFEDQYWETVLSITTGDKTIKSKPLTDGRISLEQSTEFETVAAGKSVVFQNVIFAGPKTADALKSSGIAGLEETIDYGWFWFLAQPFLWMLNWLFAFVGNYGLAIIGFTIILRIVMWPLTRKSTVAMIAMQKMQPELQRIQKLYKNDKMRLQMEMMNLYKTHGASPMSGCLPMLIQIPIFFALYKALLISVPMRHAGFLWISDLSAMDALFILPLIMGATMWWQQKLQTPKIQNTDVNDPMQQSQKMMKWMPVIFTVLFLWMPSGLVLYWTISNLFGIFQMRLIKRKV